MNSAEALQPHLQEAIVQQAQLHAMSELTQTGLGPMDVADPLSLGSSDGQSITPFEVPRAISSSRPTA